MERSPLEHSPVGFQAGDIEPGLGMQQKCFPWELHAEHSTL